MLMINGSPPNTKVEQLLQNKRVDCELGGARPLAAWLQKALGLNLCAM